jgi:predicted kinase
MELELAERDDLAAALYGSWYAAGGPLDEELLWVYAAMRALIRVDVALRRADQLPHGLEQELNIDHARSLLRLAETLTWRVRRPIAVVFAGLSGSGKTTIASHLAHRWGLERLSSDHVRKSLVGVGTSARAPQEAYLDGVSLGVYESLGARAGAALEDGRSVVVDATFRRRRDYDAFSLGLAGATAVKSQTVALLLVADADELRNRIEQRARTGASDATLEVLEQQIDECPSLRPELRDAIEISTQAEFADVVSDINDVVLEQSFTR